MFNLNLFTSEYLDQIPPWQKVKEASRGIFWQGSRQKNLFLLKIKIKQNPGCSNKEHNAIFEQLHQNIRPYPGNKKICIDQWLGKSYCMLGRIWGKWDVGLLCSNKVLFVPNTVVWTGGKCSTREFLQFLLSFNGNSISSIYTDTKFLYKY